MVGRRFLKAFRTPATARLFAGVVALTCSILLLLRFLLDDYSGSRILGDILESLISTFIAALGISFFIKFFVPRDVEEEIDLVEPRDLQDEFSSLLRSATSWKYKGNFGRYFRTSVLPLLSVQAAEKCISIEVECMIIDPDNTGLCEEHASSRNSVKTADGKRDWNAREVKIEVYATILCCFIYKNTLDLRLGLLAYFESPRFDISPSVIIITREDKKAPAVRVSKGSYLFQAVIRDYRIAMRQCREINLERNGLSLENIDKAAAQKILVGAGLDPNFIATEIESICAKAAEKKNPYT